MLSFYSDSNFTLEQIQDTAHKYYMDDLCVKDKSNIVGCRAAMWAGRNLSFIGYYN